MIRLVIDTNVYISALMFGGLPGSLLDLVFLQSFVTVISADLLDETRRETQIEIRSIS
jgi:putative PIN family toxin of toxin-antitoxin system